MGALILPSSRLELTMVRVVAGFWCRELPRLSRLCQCPEYGVPDTQGQSGEGPQKNQPPTEQHSLLSGVSRRALHYPTTDFALSFHESKKREFKIYPVRRACEHILRLPSYKSRHNTPLCTSSKLLDYHHAPQQGANGHRQFPCTCSPSKHIESRHHVTSPPPTKQPYLPLPEKTATKKTGRELYPAARLGTEPATLSQSHQKPPCDLDRGPQPRLCPLSQWPHLSTLDEKPRRWPVPSLLPVWHAFFGAACPLYSVR